ncbi:hypothetical protein [Pseudobacillus badius]|uniref:hypothetical protein n=1 Tax=Bacillus badius TaxID=1455 RepID=UPI0007B3AFDF|nr:hypothetical protein [Bacillus badius]KZR58334.1 DNA-binding protein [Bacillus badius]
MVYRNLRAEMARNNITIQDIADLLNVRYATACDKMNGKYRFFYDEAKAIKEFFFKDQPLEYLFESDEKTA